VTNAAPIAMEHLLPSDFRWPLTTTIGAFEASAERLASWLVQGFSEGPMPWAAERLAWSGLDDFVSILFPLSKVGVSRVGIFEAGGWSFVLNNSANGTDLGMTPSLCARELGCTALRLTCETRQYPATILEVYSPDSSDGLRCRRVVCAANDGGRWTFIEHGQPFSFETVDAYKSRRIGDRFTPEMLHGYAAALGLPKQISCCAVEDAFLLRCARDA